VNEIAIGIQEERAAIHIHKPMQEIFSTGEDPKQALPRKLH
jgi:phosphopantetheinyl transferase